MDPIGSVQISIESGLSEKRTRARKFSSPLQGSKYTPRSQPRPSSVDSIVSTSRSETSTQSANQGTPNLTLPTTREWAGTADMETDRLEGVDRELEVAQGEVDLHVGVDTVGHPALDVFGMLERHPDVVHLHVHQS
jgi:hypothetical protein